MQRTGRDGARATRGLRRRRARLVAGALVAAGALLGGAEAHVFRITDVLLVLKSEGVYEIDVRMDVDALALGVSPETDSAEVAAALEAMPPATFEATVEGVRDTITRRVRLRFDDVKQTPRVSFPEADAPAEEGAPPTVLGTVARLSGRIPQGAKQLRFGLSRAMGPMQLTIFEQSTLRAERFTLGDGEDSPVYLLGQAATATAERAESVVPRYVTLGFEHILPRGVDHVLFVLGLCLLAARVRPLLWQISAFTLAHSVTLGLSMGNVVSLPSSIVEPLIALSIAYVAIENVWTSELKPWRPALVFGFGLLHGLGFAGALRQLGLPQGRFLAGLISFNAGVELGQLAVIAVALATIGWFRDRPWYRPRIVRPLSIAIAIVALYWTAERVGWSL